jgi:hypothetical protein
MNPNYGKKQQDKFAEQRERIRNAHIASLRNKAKQKKQNELRKQGITSSLERIYGLNPLEEERAMLAEDEPEPKDA